MSFVLVTDAVCDLNADLVESLGVKVLPMEFTIGDKAYKHYPDCREMSIKDFYQAIREGAMPTTTQINISSFNKAFEPILKEGKDILYICFTSGLSGTYNTCMIAVSDLMEKYPDRKIMVLDSACASLGEGNLVYHVANKVNSGATIEEAFEYAKETKKKVAHWFVVDDLEHLKRGGRISSITATFGKALQIKPLLSVNDDALALARKMADERKLYLLNSINPYRPEGQKSVLFEIMDQLRYNVPDRIILPVGNAANIWAVYKAVTELQEVGWIDKVPMLTGIQAEGASPVARAFRQHAEDFIPEENPETVATAIRIGNPVSGRKALKAIYSTGGYSTTVTDEEIISAQQLLGRREGVCVEPASAASVAGLRKLRQEGVVDRDERVVCICTGNGLKDPDTIINNCAPPIRCGNSVADVERILSE